MHDVKECIQDVLECAALARRPVELVHRILQGSVQLSTHVDRGAPDVVQQGGLGTLRDMNDGGWGRGGVNKTDLTSQTALSDRLPRPPSLTAFLDRVPDRPP